MYYRIKNRLDAKCLMPCLLDSGVPAQVGERIMEIAGTLDDEYGARRSPLGMGGYILFFPDTESYERCVVEVWDFYNIDPMKYEFSDPIGDYQLSEIKWIEKLFLLGSDDSLMLVYPQESVI